MIDASDTSEAAQDISIDTAIPLGITIADYDAETVIAFNAALMDSC